MTSKYSRYSGRYSSQSGSEGAAAKTRGPAGRLAQKVLTGAAMPNLPYYIAGVAELVVLAVWAILTKTNQTGPITADAGTFTAAIVVLGALVVANIVLVAVVSVICIKDGRNPWEDIIPLNMGKAAILLAVVAVVWVLVMLWLS